MAPEYAFHGEFSVKSDVFSLGVVILEIVSGKRNRGFNHTSSYHTLLEQVKYPYYFPSFFLFFMKRAVMDIENCFPSQAWLLWEENRGLELMDRCYMSSVVESQVKRCIQVGLLCVQNVADERPLMQSVVLMLSCGDAVLPRPKKPAFFLHSSSSSVSLEHTSRNGVTMSSAEGR